MNQKLRLQLVGLMEEGMTYHNSQAVRQIVDSSQLMEDFYQSLNAANSKLKEYFQSKAVKRSSAKLDKFIDDTLEPKKPMGWFKLISGFAVTSCALMLAFITFYQSPVNVAQAMVVQIPDTLPEQRIKNYEFNTVWSLADQLHEEMDASIYQIMFAMYLSNPDAFINADLNNIRGDMDLRVPNIASVQSVSPTVAQQFIESFL